MKNLKKTILTRRSDQCVSLFIPTHRTGNKVEQNSIRYKNMLQETEKRLIAKDMPEEKVLELLKNPRQLLEDAEFWKYPSDGLAVFFSNEDFYTYRVSIEFTEVLVISNRYHVKPLLPFITKDSTFYILAISQNRLRLLESTQNSVEEIDLGDTPESFAETFSNDFPQKHLQYHTGTPSSGSASGSAPGIRGAMYHGHDPSSDLKKNLQQWFRTINAKIIDLLSDSQVPLVLAGVDYLFPLYKEVNTYPHLMDQGIHGNPDECKPEDLRIKAMSIVEPVFNKKREARLEQYRSLAETGLTTTDVSKAVLAAHYGQIAVLFVAVGVQVWGRFDPEEHKVQIHETAESQDEDLLNFTAVQALSKGAEVFVLSKEEMPDQALLAAVLRY